MGCLLLTVMAIAALPGPCLRAEEPQTRATLQGHAKAVLSVAFSPDGKTLASASLDKTIKLWEVAAGKEQATLHGHSDWVVSVAFSPDGRTLASASDDHTVKLWDTVTGKERATLRAAVMSVAFSPDGKTLASAGRDRTITLWEVATGKDQAILGGHCDSVISVAFSPDGKTLASASHDKTVKLWDVATGKEQATLQGAVMSVAFSPDGKTLASAGNDKTVKLWEVITGKERATLQGNSSAVRLVAFSPDGKILASVSFDKTVKLWDAATSKERATLPGALMSVAFSPDDKTLASGSVDETIKLLDIPASKQATARSRILTPEDLDGLWTRLAGEDTVKAYQATWALVGAPDQAVLLVKERLRPALEPNVQQIPLLIVDLDSDQFAARQRATEKLEKVAVQAESALRQRLTDKPSLEVRQRIERLLSSIEPQHLRALRAVEVLEHIGSSEAKQVLRILAKGAEDAALTKEAKASLERLDMRAAVDK